MKKLLQSIPFKRLVIYLLLLGSAPLLYLPFDYLAKSERLKEGENYLTQVKLLERTKEQRQAINTVVRNTYAKADPKYLEKLASLPLLENEKSSLEKLVKESSFPGGASNEARYKFLSGEENRLHFLPGSSQSKEKVEETSMAMTHSVEIDAADLKKILQLIEEKQPLQPELLITDFKLIKKTSPNKREVYELQLQLVKREFIP